MESASCNARHGVGDERDLAHHEVRALIEHERDHKGQNQDRHLAVGLGGEEQHGDNDDGDIDHNDADLVVDGLLLRVAEVGGDIEIVAGERVLDALERVETALVVLVVVKSDGEERTDVVVVLVGLVERQPCTPSTSSSFSCRSKASASGRLATITLAVPKVVNCSSMTSSAWRVSESAGR